MRVTKLDEHRADAITRFEVIDNSGRALVKYDAVVDVHIQDDGRTMKVFLYDRLKQEKDAKGSD